MTITTTTMKKTRKTTATAKKFQRPVYPPLDQVQDLLDKIRADNFTVRDLEIAVDMLRQAGIECDREELGAIKCRMA